jgi:hypothetical protein
MQDKTQKRITIRCEQCNGDSIYGTAQCTWSDANQNWEIQDWEPENMCNKCGETTFKEVELVWSSEIPQEVMDGG